MVFGLERGENREHSGSNNLFHVRYGTRPDDDRKQAERNADTDACDV